MEWLDLVRWFEWIIFALGILLTLILVVYALYRQDENIFLRKMKKVAISQWEFDKQVDDKTSRAKESASWMNRDENDEIEKAIRDIPLSQEQWESRIIANRRPLIKFVTIVAAFWLVTIIDVGYYITCHHELRLERKVNELSDLRQRLQGKKQEVAQLQLKYQGEIDSLVKEIKDEQRINNVQSYSHAQQLPKITYDLSLIQSKKVYIAKLQETGTKLQYGTNELEFLERRAIDDLRMVKTFNRKEVESLVADINNVIAKYLPEAGELAIEVDPNSMQSPEQIWDQINAGN
ncbi:MAG: hypothetical protein NTX82_03825 [Candidatus Parcubacteria bacterium]|nr:hypothetical protein [Candidatus Parcubacteria bacterium]